MASAVKTPVNADLLTWAREEYGLTVDEAAHALGVSTNRVEAWEQGIDLPTLNQVRNVAKLYNRTPAFFLMNHPPSEGRQQRPTDFRRFESNSPSFGPAVAREVSRARSRRENILKIQEATPHELPTTLDLTGNPVGAARQIRQLIDIDVDTQTRFRDTGQALRTWINAVEDLGVMVFQMSRVSPDVCRGFSIYSDTLPIIVVNGAETPEARQFTLFHELGHLISRTSAVCDIWREEGVEARCNAFAAEFLMPRTPVLNLIQRRSDNLVTLISGMFKVSQSAAAVRLRTLGQISQEELDDFLREAGARARAAREAQSGGPPPQVLKVRNLGPRFVSTVLGALDHEQISVVEAAQYLESKVQYLSKLEEEVERVGYVP